MGCSVAFFAAARSPSPGVWGKLTLSAGCHPASQETRVELARDCGAKYFDFDLAGHPVNCKNSELA